MLHRNKVYAQYFLSFVICGNTHSVFTLQRAAHSQRCQLPSWRWTLWWHRTACRIQRTPVSWALSLCTEGNKRTRRFIHCLKLKPKEKADCQDIIINKEKREIALMPLYQQPCLHEVKLHFWKGQSHHLQLQLINEFLSLDSFWSRRWLGDIFNHNSFIRMKPVVLVCLLLPWMLSQPGVTERKQWAGETSDAFPASPSSQAFAETWWITRRREKRNTNWF